MVGKYKVVTLCGSTKFKDAFIEAQKKLTLEGNIVISVGLFGHSGDSEVWDDGVKEMLDDMHKRKIDMADVIMVIDVNDYIGESTKSEIEYAKSKGKWIFYYNHPEMYYDDVGGFHDSGTGYSPSGMYCGECSRLTCKDCKSSKTMKYKDFKETDDYLTASQVDLWSDKGDEIDNLPDEELDNMEVLRYHRHGCVLYVTLKK